MARRLFLCLLGLLLLAGCSSGEQAERKQARGGKCTYARLLQEQDLIIVPLSTFKKKRIGADEQDWRPRALLQQPCQGPAVPPRWEIDDRTEFYAFYSPRQGLKAGEAVVFSWYYTPARKLYARPVVKILAQHPGFPRPVATDYIWSAPDMGGKLLSLGGLRSVRSKADWERSRIFGPRFLRVSRLQGFQQGRPQAGATLAEASFEIHEMGVRVY